MFALLIPEEGSNEHLKLLSTISRKLMNTAFREEIKSSKTDMEILKLLKEIE